MQSAEQSALNPPIDYDQDFYTWTQQMAAALRHGQHWTLKTWQRRLKAWVNAIVLLQ